MPGSLCSQWMSRPVGSNRSRVSFALSGKCLLENEGELFLGAEMDERVRVERAFGLDRGPAGRGGDVQEGHPCLTFISRL